MVVILTAHIICQDNLKESPVVKLVALFWPHSKTIMYSEQPASNEVMDKFKLQSMLNEENVTEPSSAQRDDSNSGSILARPNAELNKVYNM